jgi:hypothetical protein
MPNWREEVSRIDRLFLRPENHALLKATGEWYDTSFSTNIPAYQQRIKQLLDGFGDLYTSDLLNVHKYGAATGKGNRPAGTGDDQSVGGEMPGDASSVSSVSITSMQDSFS